MSGKELGPGKVLDGFQSLIFQNEEDESTPVTESPQEQKAGAPAPQSSYQQRDTRQEKLTEVAPRRLPQFFRKP